MYDGRGYDKEKYRGLLLDVAETVLSALGFSRQEFGPRTRKEQYRDYFQWERNIEEQLERETESME